MSVAGVVSIESPLAHSKTEKGADRPFKSLNSMAYVQETVDGSLRRAEVEVCVRLEYFECG